MQSRTVPISLFGSDGTTIYANVAWRQAFGGPDASSACALVMSLPLEAGEGLATLPDGRAVHVAATPAGRLASGLLPAIALTDLGEAIRGVVHDLNNHLHVGASVAEVVADSVDFDAEDMVLIDDLKHACQRAMQLAEQLRAVGRALTDPPQPVAIDAVLDDVALDSGRWTNGAVTLVVEPSPSTQVLAEHIVLHRIVANVVAEAAECAVPGSSVTVTARAAGPQMLLQVDALSAEPVEALRQRVEEPFFASGTGRSHGGVGLTVARMLARSCGGDITFASNAPPRVQWHVSLPNAPG